MGEGGQPGANGNNPYQNCDYLGNVLIIQEDNGYEEQPDDNKNGGKISLDFLPMVEEVYEIGLLDVDFPVSITVVYINDKGQMQEKPPVSVPLRGNNSLQTVILNVKNVVQLRFNLEHSAAITSIAFCYLPPESSPTPASVPSSPAPSASPSKSPSESPSSAPVDSVPTPATTDTPRTAVPATTDAPPTAVPATTDAPPTPTTPMISGKCDALTVNFDKDTNGMSLAAGLYMENEWAAYGLHLSAAGGVGSKPRLFDMTSPGTAELGDPDLGAPNKRCPGGGLGVGEGGEPNDVEGANCNPLGNALIIQERNQRPEIPDDNVNGGLIRFDFKTRAEYIFDIGLLDIDYKMTIKVVFKNDSGNLKTKFLSVPILGDNSYQNFPVNAANVRMLVVETTQSAAVTHITYCPGKVDGTPTVAPTKIPATSAPTSLPPPSSRGVEPT